VKALLRRLRLPLIDRYLLGQMAPPMALAFGVVLIALMLYRALELFNLLASSSARFGLVLAMVGNLAPHYLGLAIPAAYFISMFVVVARLSDTSEVDALLGTGMSIDRLTAPFVGVGLVVAVISIVLLGYIQPYGRYGFNSDLNAALHSQWDARLQPRTFVSPTASLTLYAQRVDPAGRGLRQVFLRRVEKDGAEQVFTAARGVLAPSEDGKRLSLVLEDGQQYQDDARGRPVVGAFSRLAVDTPFSADAPPFRTRGQSARELTLDELPARMFSAPTAEERAAAATELYARLVRSISAPLLPLLAIPLGMAAKRGRRAPGLVVAAVLLFVYEHAIDMGQSVANQGHVPPALAIWTPFLLFTALCVWLFLNSRVRPGQTPFTLVVDQLDRAISLVRRRRPAAA
jgi:lipopolysaccharide export system permease protein